MKAVIPAGVDFILKTKKIVKIQKEVGNVTHKLDVNAGDDAQDRILPFLMTASTVPIRVERTMAIREM